MSIVRRVPFVSVSSLFTPACSVLVGVIACAIGASGVQAQTASTAQNAQTYFERSFVLAADRKCSLFSPSIGQALGAAALQTRGTLLREGHEPREIVQLEHNAQSRAGETACTDSDLGVVKGRIEHAFTRWSRAARIDFPSSKYGWLVDRFSGSREGWRLMQQANIGASPVRFGLMGKHPDDVQPVAVVSFVGRSRPYAARLVMRDESLLPRPMIVSAGRASVPMQSGRKAVFAARQSAAPETLLLQGKRQGEAWAFPRNAFSALENLDPREEFWVEFLFRDDTVARVKMEVGDLKAAQAFLALGPV